LKKINEVATTSVYSFVSSQFGEWSSAGETISMGNYEGYLEVPKEHLKSAYHHLLNSIEPKPFQFLKCNPKSMSIFGCGSLDVVDFSSEGSSTVRHSWRWMDEESVFDKIRIMNKGNFKSHDFSVDELQAKRRESVYVAPEESLEAESVSAIKEEDDDDESIDYAEASEIEANKTLEVASQYVYADYLPSSSETFIFDFSKLCLDRQDALKLFPLIVNANRKLAEVDQNQTDAKSKKLEFLVCDLVLTFLKISEYAINGKSTDHRKRTEKDIIDRFLKDFASLLKNDSKISKDAFYNLFKERFINKLDKSDGSKGKRNYSFPVFLSEVLEDNQKYIAPYNFIKQDQPKK
jgi:hypothetical protein